MNKRKVSVIIPIFNQEKYLDDSLSSVIKQDYANLEIICVNDGSTDNSLSILKEFRNKDNRIKIINKKNGGLVSAVSRGVEEATGDLLCFLDPDDSFGPDFIKELENEIEDYDFVSMGFYYNKNKEYIPNRILEPKVYCYDDLVQLRRTYPDDNQEGSLSKRLLVARWNKLYQTRCVKKAVKEYSKFPDVTLGEDTIFTYLILCHSYKAKTIKGVNSYYYTLNSDNSMCSNGSIQQHLEKAKIAKDTFSILLKENGDVEENALILYFYQVESLFQRIKAYGPEKDFEALYNYLKKDSEYSQALNLIIKKAHFKKRVKLMFRRACSNGRIYKKLSEIFVRIGLKKV